MKRIYFELETKKFNSMPKKKKDRSAQKGKGKAWHRGENKRLQRSMANKYVQILENGELDFDRVRSN